ncbi:helix-turn-helix domain-containing protein [Streptomyces prunicolor]|uniref:helix-turn-helix domain-containing protein n=1 Tax=Streptomyces prunicolor TaxID=67348 RepID=UPI002258DEAF|nr:helix-turn-helix domain-containing protein [Streptomyces prunicolor]MCX5239736.1 helix-turn-helix domain-containing protein [Streptomyces prunicolor]
MTDSEPVQAPRTAWMHAMRAEALRMDRPEISKIVHVGWVIASYADADGTNADPATETIAAIVGSSQETVSRAKKVLKALGVLVERRRPNTNSEYLLHPPLGDQGLDWDEHLHLYTDTPQARAKRRLKEKAIAEALAAREAEPGAAQTREAHQDAAGTEPRPPISPGTAPESHAEKTGPVLASVPAPPGRARRKPAADGPTQPPLLLAVPGQDVATVERVRQTIADLGVPAALRRYGRGLVMRELVTGTCESPRHHPGPAEAAVPCGYCNASAGTACSSSAGLRGAVHEARLDTWDITYTTCPSCKATAGSPCTDPGGTPRHGIHPQRAALGAQMRETSEQRPRTSTGT